jgi:hypothetical protein
MGVLKIAGFTGMWPQRDPRALPDNAATYAENIRVDGGQYLRGVSSAVLVQSLAGATLTVFRIPLPGDNTLVNSYWMQFADVDTDVVRGPLVNDSFERFYWASPSTGLKFAPKADIVVGSTGYESGVEPPATALSAEPVPGTGTIEDGANVGTEETRVYTVTFINTFGEESQPGPTTEVVGYSDQVYDLSNLPQPSAPGDKPPYETIRIYRTVSGLTGNTGFYKVVDLDVGQTDYSDNFSHAIVTGNVPMESTAWSVPPADLQGLVSMPNGILVSWKDNDLYFSENYRPHAWPSEYMLSVDFPIVGLGVFGNTCVVATTGNAYMVSGVKSNSMTLAKIGEPLPCLSRRSIVSTPVGIIWATERGLAQVGPGGASVVSEGFITREEWQNDYDPSNIRATLRGGDYVAVLSSGDGFCLSLTNAMERGISWMDWPTEIVNIGTEPWTGKAWMIDIDANLHEMEVPDEEPLAYTWRSKEYIYPRPTNFSVFQCFYDDTDGDDLHLKVLATLRGNDGSTTETVVFDEDLTSASGRERRLPSGFKADVWTVEFTGNVELQSFAMASSVAELRSV